MRKKVFLFIFIVLTLGTIFPDESTITLKIIFEQLEKNHPQFSLDEKTLAAEKQRERLLQTSRAWFFFTSPYNQYLGEYSAQQLKAESADIAGIKAGIAHQNLDTGGSMSIALSSQVNFLVNPAEESDPLSFYNSMEIQYTQPLVNNNFVRDKNFSLVEQQLENMITTLLIKEKQKDLYFQAADLFITWLYWTEIRTILQDRVQIAKELVTRVNKLYKANLIDKIDIIRSEDSLRSAELLFAQSTIQLSAVTKQLSLLTTIEISPEGSPRYTVHEVPEIRETGIFDTITQTAVPVKIINAKIKKLEEKIRYLEDKKTLSLTLNVKGALMGKDPDFISTFTEVRPDASVSLEMALPFHHNEIDEEIVLLRIQIDELRENINLYLLNEESRLETILSYLQNYRETFIYNKELIKSAGIKTREEIKLYDQGRGQLTFVLQSKDDEERARMSYAENLYKARKIFLEYLFLFDNPLEKIAEYHKNE